MSVSTFNNSRSNLLLLTFSSPGRTRFARLHLIGTTSTVLSNEALKLAVIEAKSGKDVSRYEKAVRALAAIAPTEAEASLDTTWVRNVQQQVHSQSERLEQELRGYKNNLIKESIRVRLILSRHSTGPG